MTRHDSEEIAAIHHELHAHLPPEPALRVKALESLLVEKGLVESRTVDAWIDHYAEDIGPRRGAAMVARAWLDDAYRARLLADGGAAAAELGFAGAGTGHLIVVENTATVHNLVVCTLCSCYPHAVLGVPPGWYKMAAYRARAVRDPRGVLAEFGVTLDDAIEVRVWDSTAELRYLVLPQRPAGTEDWDAERLARIVTRNAMIGTERDLRAGKAR